MKCRICEMLYIKANGELPCGSDHGEDIILSRLPVHKGCPGRYDWLWGQRRLNIVSDVLNGPTFVEIRRSFLRQRFPFGTCAICSLLQKEEELSSETVSSLYAIHLEPSFLCHIDCAACISPKRRKELKAPPYNFPFSWWQKIVDDLQRADIRVQWAIFEGRGEPLMNPDTPRMIRYIKDRIDCYSTLTTHGNFGFTDEIIESGLDQIEVSIDGADEESYKKYRKGGSFEKAVKFVSDLVVRKRLLRASKPLVWWKYILFEWNDSDDQIRKAHELSKDIGTNLEFILTNTEGKSKRFTTKNFESRIQELAPGVGMQRMPGLVGKG